MTITRWSLVGLGMCIGCLDGAHVASVNADSNLGSPAPGESPETPEASPSPSASTTPSPTPLRAACLSFAVCDDFEAQAPGDAPNTALWNILKQNNNETVTVDNSRAFDGNQSVHIHTTNNGYEQAMLVNTSLFPAANNNFYGRMYLYFAGNQPQTHFNLVTAWGTLQGQTAGTYVNYGGQYNMFLANYYNANNPSAVLDLWQHAGINGPNGYTNTTSMPTNRWTCLEWQFKGDTNEMHMWLDGSEVATMSLMGVAAECCRTTVWSFPPFRQVALGWTLVSNQEAFDHFDLWLDDVALDDQRRIGCLTP